MAAGAGFVSNKGVLHHRHALIEWRFDMQGSYSVKGMWGKVVGGVLATVSVVGAALLNYFVENGALPAWLSKAVAWCIDFATFQVPIPVWGALLLILLVGAGVMWLVYTYERRICEDDSYTDKLTTAYQKLKSHCEALEKSNSELEGANTHLASECAKLDTFTSGLVTENAELESANSQLNQKLTEIAQAGKSAKLSVSSLGQEQLSVFEFIGRCLDSGSDVYVDTVVRGLRLSLLTAEDIMDALCDSKFIERYDSLIEAESFLLTTAGRSCYLELKRSMPIKPATRHG